MYAQSNAYPEMIGMMRAIKDRYRLKLVGVTNEGREITEHRVRTFGLDGLLDILISSCFVHIRKPDTDIFRIALDVAQERPDQVIYIDDRAMFVEVASTLGITGIHHTGYESTRRTLAELGIAYEPGDGGG